MTSDTVIAVDASADRIAAGLVTRDGTVRLSRRHPIGAGRDPEATLETILQLVTGLADAARAEGVTPRAVGVAVPGTVDEAAGVVTSSPGLGLRDLPLCERVVAATGLPAGLCQATRAAGVAEARLGAGRDAAHVLYVSVGSEIGAAHVRDGSAAAGAHGSAGLLGHVVVRRNGPPCTCGARGCLDTVAATDGLRRRYAELGGGEATVEQITAAVVDGRAAAARAWQEAVDALAEGLVIGQALLDVEVIVVGGPLSTAGETLFNPLHTAVKERVTVHQPPRVLPAALGDDAGCVGIGLLALDPR